MRRHVALWGLPEDGPLKAVRRELSRHGVPHVMLDQREMRQPADVDAIGALFVRIYDTAPLEQRLFAWADVAPGMVVNRPSAMSSNWAKPLQSELIRSHGFAVPATLVTTTPDDAREFVAEHRHVICKSVSGHRSVVSRVQADDLDRIADVSTCPTQFQEYVPGVDWRVHVVGDAVYPCEVHCAADDYRAAHAAGEHVEINDATLPPSIETRCRTLARELDLPLAGIDLRRTDDDAWYCFEVNTAPAFTWFERATGQPIAAAVAQLLADGRAGAAA